MPVTWARNMRSSQCSHHFDPLAASVGLTSVRWPDSSASADRTLTHSSNSLACRATINSSLVGMIHNCTRLSVHGSAFRPWRCRWRRIELDAEPVEIGADGRTHARRVFADAAGEDDGVGPVQEQQIRPEVVPHRGDEHIESQLRSCVARPLLPFRCRAGRCCAAQAQQPERLARSSRTCSSVLPVARMHHRQGKQDRSRRRGCCAASRSAGSCPCCWPSTCPALIAHSELLPPRWQEIILRLRLVQQLRGPLGDVAMAGAVKAPALDAVLLGPFQRHRVEPFAPAGSSRESRSRTRPPAGSPAAPAPATAWP